MNISLNWIKDYVDLEGISVKDLWYRFTMSAAEVEDVVEMGGDIKDVIVGKVVRVEPHPSSDKLKICQVDTGSGLVQSVCGAPNVREGMLAPFAKEGGSIKKVAIVGRAEVSGVESCGILCSASEIGISDNHEGLLELPEGLLPGTDIKSVIDIDDVIIEIDNKSLTNRPDLWGHYGIAREIAAIFRRKLKPMIVDETLENSKLPELDIKIEDADKCFRYSGIRIENIKVRKSPLNMQTRLFYCGMRPISAIVDLTNYLMLEVGQPMHAFDKRQISGIVVKSTQKEEKFKTLDGVERSIPADVLMICNMDKPVAIAGIMGGENSEVSADTSAIILESANFEGSSTRRNATKIGMRTEASARYEKMLDPELTMIAAKRFVKLLRDMQKDIEITSDLTDKYVNKLKPITISIDKPFIDRYMGNYISNEEVEGILKSLEFGVERSGDLYTIKVPTFRATKDISMKADIIEEISRIHGYDNIEPKTVEVELQPLEYNEERITEHRIRDIMSEKFAFSEVNSYVWYNNAFNSSVGIGLRGNVKLLDSHAKDMNILRDSMIPQMLEFADVNRKSFDDFGIFEIGSVFNAPDTKTPCTQHKNFCALAGSKIKSEDSMFYELKGIITTLVKLLKNTDVTYVKSSEEGYPWVHPVKSVDVLMNGRKLGVVSSLHPQIKQNLDKKLNLAFAELDMTIIHEVLQKTIKYTEPSKYPEVTLDFSFLVDKTVHFEKLTSDITAYSSNLLQEFRYVDTYAGKGMPEDKKSVTFRFVIGSKEKTLSSEDISGFSSGLLEYMKNKGYTLR